MKTVATIQARLGSSRLRNKVLLQIPPESGVSMLELCVRKAMLAILVDDVVVVTPDRKIGWLCDKLNIQCFVWDFNKRDVLREYYETASVLAADIIVRLTADCPLLRPSEIDRCVKLYLENDCDLVFNTDETTGQLEGEGSDVEVMSYQVLKQAYYTAEGQEREHPTLWIRRNLNSVFTKPKVLGIRSVNTKGDYEFVCDYIRRMK